MTEMEYPRRLKALRKRLEAVAADGLLITNPANVAYLTGFLGHDATLLITKRDAFFITDSRYVEEACAIVPSVFHVELAGGTAFEKITSIVKTAKLNRVGFEGYHMPHSVASRLKRYLGSSKLIETKKILEDIRSVKDADEIKAIRNSINLNGKIFKKNAGLVRPGAIEQDIACSIEIDFLRHGSKKAFDTIVAAGANSSKPHARPGSRAVSKNSFVMIDMGCVLSGYCSDLTRMVITGSPIPRFKKIYHIVKTAQEKAIALVKPGFPISGLDRAARGYIEQKGYGNNFGHSLGHGIGLEVHEEPSVSFRNDGNIKEGMVFTVEPAIYIPGFGGVRIEDIVLATKDGCQILTR